MITIGVTGPSGAGKGAVSGIMQSHGFNVIDADKVYHDVISPPSACLDELVAHVGAEILTPDGHLDRSVLSARVFSDSEKLELLNGITHKYVVNKIRGITGCTCSIMPSACVIDAPLLIEAGLKGDCTFTIAVLADKNIRAQRISVRDGISHDKAMARINAQKDDDYYISQCDYVIYNDGNFAELRERVETILKNRSLT